MTKRILSTLALVLLAALSYAGEGTSSVQPASSAVLRWHALHGTLPFWEVIKSPPQGGSGGASLTSSNIFTGTANEFDGTVYFGGQTTAFQNCKWNTTQTPDTFVCAVGTTGRSIVLVEAGDEGFDFAHAAQTNPALFIHSSAQSTTEWLGLGMQGTVGVLSMGVISNGFVIGTSATVNYWSVFTNGAQTSPGGTIGWSSTANNANGSAADAAFRRVAAGVAGTTSSPATWFQQTPARSTLAADYTNATTTFSNTALSITVTTGRKYSFKLVLFVSDSLAADGAKFDFNGGTATATDFRVHCTLFDTALLLSTQATALATAFSQATVTGSGMFECYGSFEPSGTGTLIVRAAQNAHTTGTLTVFRGSNLWIEDMP